MRTGGVDSVPGMRKILPMTAAARKMITAWTPEGKVHQKDATRLTLEETYETEVVLYDRQFKTWIANREEFVTATRGE